jgi:nitroimidazol reductase NimA-like FMN-containing flavoprotein (pyridoxamine 5'-phosphate oxidase superfamily)
MNKELLIFSRDFINERFMAVVSCISNGKPRSFTCWYVVYNGQLYWKSRTESIHSKAFAENPEASICIYDHGALYPDHKEGVQITGTVRKVTDRDEIENFVKVSSKKFGDKVLEKNDIDELHNNTKSAFYAFMPQQLKLVSKKLDVHMDEYQDFNL